MTPEEIKEAVRRKGFNCKEFAADVVRCHAVVLSQTINGSERYPLVRERLAKALGVPVSEIRRKADQPKAA